MNDKPKLSKEEIQAITNKFSNGNKIDANALSNALKSNLNKEQTEKLNKVLKNEEMLKKLLNTPEAQKLMKKFTGEK
ncbi:MAG: hypothetical protein K5917_02855 [Clostridiales bacterium]|nr:hypothetical protein [Clostridiales bacterium]